jgi:hypothetical protein
VRNFDPLRAKFLRKREHLVDACGILLVNDEIGGKRQAAFANATRSFQLPGMPAAIASEPISLVRPHVLKAELNMVDTRGQERGHRRVRQQHPRCDDVRVEPSR